MSDKQPAMTVEQIQNWIEACNHEPARQVLRDYLSLQAAQQEAEPVGIRSSKLIDKEKMFSVIEEYRDYHHPPTSEWDFNSGFRHAIKIVVGMAMEGRFAAPQPAKPAVPEVAPIVVQAMQDVWDDWVGDTDCIPPDLEIHGPPTTRITFTAFTWADRVGDLVQSRLAATPQPGEGDNKK